jgi:hypothetical protein
MFGLASVFPKRSTVPAAWSTRHTELPNGERSVHNSETGVTAAQLAAFLSCRLLAPLRHAGGR